MAEAAQKQVLASVKGLLKSGAYADLTISCGSESYKVHKNIVCERADFFARAIKFGGQEAQKDTIDLPEDEPTIVKLLVQYLYEGEYEPLLPDTTTLEALPVTPVRPSRSLKAKKKTKTIRTSPHSCFQMIDCLDPYVCEHHQCGSDCRYDCDNFICTECHNSSPSNGTSDQLLLHAKMYEIADKYDVIGLKDLVIEKFKRSCQSFWDDAKFAAAAHHAFMTTPEHDKGLRDVVADTIAAHCKQLVFKPEIEALLTEFNGLAYGLYKRKVEER